MDEIRCDPGGADLQVVTAGGGDSSLLLLPGFGGGISAYATLIEALSHEHHVVGISPRGFGSSAWSAPYSISTWVHDVVDVTIDVVGAPTAVVGHSFGALIATAAAAWRPEWFRAVLSLDQVLDLDIFVDMVAGTLGHWQAIRRAVVEAAGDVDALTCALAAADGMAGHPGEQLSSDELEQLALRWSVQDPAVLDPLTPERYRQWMADPLLADLPSRYHGPLLCIDGDPAAGSIVSELSAQRHRQLYPDSRQVRLEGVGHDLGHDDDPHRVADAMRPFLLDVT
jgi:pimeloyl-ACP methyl ester carboxylesterase